MNIDLRLKIGFVTALLATAVSLFFSEIMLLPPCSLCWYQRICMYPLVIVFGIGLTKPDRGAFSYAKLLSLSGLVIATYHCLLYYGVIPEAVAPCRSGIPCTQKQIEFLGFVTIPLLSLCSFALLTLISFSPLNREER